MWQIYGCIITQNNMLYANCYRGLLIFTTDVLAGVESDGVLHPFNHEIFLSIYYLYPKNLPTGFLTAHHKRLKCNRTNKIKIKNINLMMMKRVQQLIPKQRGRTGTMILHQNEHAAPRQLIK